MRSGLPCSHKISKGHLARVRLCREAAICSNEGLFRLREGDAVSGQSVPVWRGNDYTRAIVGYRAYVFCAECGVRAVLRIRHFGLDADFRYREHVRYPLGVIAVRNPSPRWKVSREKKWVHWLGRHRQLASRDTCEGA